MCVRDIFKKHLSLLLKLQLSITPIPGTHLQYCRVSEHLDWETPL